MQLIVFHYHLLPGGVTDIIVHTIQAVAAHRSDIASIQLVCGREENTKEVMARLGEIGIPIALDIVNELDYTPVTEPTEVALDRADALETILLGRYATEDAFWWIHNYHVGKNPAFTLALCRIATAQGHHQTGPPPRMLLHIHDFPECARYENLAYLTRIAGESPYPAGPTVRYAVINARDLALMRRTQIASDHIHLLVNPLPDEDNTAGAKPAKSELISGLTKFAADHGQRFDPDRPILLYPVRTIRRKNILEIALLARLSISANLIVTLPGLSDAEIPYSNLISEAFGTGEAQGVWGIGRHKHDYGVTFDDLAHGADVIVSSSVQEGFGLLFVNALRWRVPLFARYLSILDGVSSVFEGYPAHFYTTVQVPMKSPSLPSLQTELESRYAGRMEELGDFLPATARERMDGQLHSLLGRSSIDFAFLSPELQYLYLRDLDDHGFAATIRAMNQESVEALQAMPSRHCPDTGAEVERLFGFEAFADGFDRVLKSYEASSSQLPAGSPGERYESTQPILVKEFADLEYFRLLFAPMGHGRE